MSIPFYTPEDDEIVMRVADSGVELRRWSTYSFNSNFLTPTDGFSFTVPERMLSDAERAAVAVGAKVQLVLDGTPQATGVIDAIRPSASRESGAEWVIEGRDWLSCAVDAGIDPRLQFKKELTIEDVVKTALAPFGITKFSFDGDENRNAVTGQKRGTRTTKKGRPLKGRGIDTLQPYPKEGVFEFLAKFLQRHGLMMWGSADGTTVIIDRPNFSQAPIGTLVRDGNGGRSQILSGGTDIDITDQPHLIVADGFSGGGAYGKSRAKVAMAHPALKCADEAVISGVMNDYQKAGAAVILEEAFEGIEPVITPRPKIQYLHDDESHTQEELEYFVRREMSLCLRKFMSGKYSLKGHCFIASTGIKTPYAVDTVFAVNDVVSRGLNRRMWTLNRTFHKSRKGGTRTDVEFILPYSILL